MNNFWLLFKADLLKLVKSKMGKRKGKGGLITVYVILGVLLLFLSVIYTAMFTLVLPSESRHLALALICGIYTLFIFFTSVGSSKILFGASDYDMLSALPIKSSVIILSKLAYLYLIAFFGAFVSLIPSAITFMLITQSGPIVLLNALLLLPFAPILPLVLALMVGTIINIIISKVKRKALLGTIAAGVFVAAYLFLLLGVGNDNLTDEQMAGMLVSIQSVLKIFFAYSKGVAGNYLYILAYVGFAILISFAYVFVLSKTYKKVNSLIASKVASGKYNIDLKDATLKEGHGSQILALCKREFKLLFSNSGITMNIVIGPIVGIVLSIAFLVRGGLTGFAQMEGIDEQQIAMVENFIQAIVPYVPLFFVGMSYYAACSISLEGKNIWLVKSLPIKGRDWLTSKVITDLIISAPAGGIATVLFALGVGAEWYIIVIAMLILCAYSVMSSLLGLACNLKFYSFDWSTPTEVIKRGTSATISALVGMFALIPVVLIQIVAGFINMYLGFAINFIIFCVLAIIFYKLAYTNIDQKLLKIN